jgi:hypothetical protein
VLRVLLVSLRASAGLLWLLIAISWGSVGWSDSDHWGFGRGVLTLVPIHETILLSGRANVSDDRR